MESLSQIFSPFDDLEIICEEHDLPCIGLCSYYLCKEKTKFLCIKCIKSGKTCITKEKHELITLSEMLYRFFLTKENKYLDTLQIRDMENLIKEYNENELNQVTQNYYSIKEDEQKKYSLFKNNFTNLIKQIIDLSKENNISQINKLKEKYKNKSEVVNSNSDLLLKMYIPEEKITKNKDDLILYINDKFKTNDPNLLILGTKLLYDTNGFIGSVKNINEKIYLNDLTEMTEDKKKNMELKIDSLIKELEEEFDSKISQLEEELIIPKDKKSIYSYYNAVLKLQNDPKELIFKEDICSTAHKANSIDRVFCAFKSFSCESLIVWGSTSYNVEFYDCEKGKIVKTFVQAHSQTIYSCRHYPDSQKRIDYIITSSYDRSVKVWDYKQSSYILNISKAHSAFYIYSVSLLLSKNNEPNYVITSASNDKMKIWDFQGNYLRNVGQDTDNTYFIDVYYNKSKKKHYLINANSVDVKSYDFNTGNLFQKYKGTPQTWHMSVVINETKDGPILIESDGTGKIRMWDFNTAVLLKNIIPQNSVNLRGICLWNDRYLFAAGNDYKVKLFDLEEGKFVKSLEGHTSTVCTIEKIMHPKYGGCMISQGLDGKLKLWAAKQE